MMSNFGSISVTSDTERFRRLIALPDVRPNLVAKLASSRVAVIGAGGLGSASALYLAAAGVGMLKLIDPDIVALHNLGRQILFTPEDVGQSKVSVAGQVLSRQNPALQVITMPVALEEENIAELLTDVDIVLDGVDNGKTRDVLNKWCIRNKKPIIFAGAIGYEAQVFGMNGLAPCLACLFGSVADADENCATSGILGPVVGMAGMVQAQEALKFILGVGHPLWGRLWTYDAFSGTTRILNIRPRATCEVCGMGGQVKR